MTTAPKPSASPETVTAVVIAGAAPCSALVALKELREAISDFKGHGMPGFTDRALAYIVMAQADEVLKREMPNKALSQGGPASNECKQEPNPPLAPANG